MTVEEFSQKAVHRHGVDLYNAEDAIRLVELCRQASLPVWGIDAFLLFGTAIQPDMGNSIDLSSEKGGGHDRAIRFLTDRLGLGFMFEVVY